MSAQVEQKPYKGIAMEGTIANWYAKNTARDQRRFRAAARAVAERVQPCGEVLEVAPGPGYLAIEIAKSGRKVTTVDISQLADASPSQDGNHYDRMAYFRLYQYIKDELACS